MHMHCLTGYDSLCAMSMSTGVAPTLNPNWSQLRLWLSELRVTYMYTLTT